ncbi:MAG: SufS family cysteine desulfurase, partial [Acidimicrobiia bacterium]|nr:SufS family cysteine desulfurase [Acidimicrobiia bacterium]
MNGHPLVYLDSAATSQKPRSVIDAMAEFSRTGNANVHRGAYTLSNDATDRYEEARLRVAGFIGADRREVAFNRGTTSALNQVAYGWGLYNLKPGDRILLTLMEHHANIVPWQLVARHTGAELVYAPYAANYTLDRDKFHELLDERVRIVGLTAMSNVLGTINPVRELADAAHAAGAIVVVDAAQAVPHMAVDVKDLDADFLAFSGHKMLGPTGIGVLYGKLELLEQMEPAEGGGEMISDVQLEASTWAEVPHKFEAGTPPIAQAIGLGAAIEYLEKVGMDAVRSHEVDITRYALEQLGTIDDLTIYGPTDLDVRGGAVSFTLADIHPHDLATILDQRGIAIRAGHHCARPLARSLNQPATARASFYVYN